MLDDAEYFLRKGEVPQEALGAHLADVSVSIPLFGYENTSLSVRENEQIKTNILDTGKMFCIGEKNTLALVIMCLRNARAIKPYGLTKTRSQFQNEVHYPSSRNSSSFLTIISSIFSM